MTRGGAAGCLAAALWCAAARAAPAAAIDVDVAACPGVDAAEVARLLDIELAFATGPRPPQPLAVRLDCAGPRVRIAARDPITGRPLEREVTVGPDDPGRDRTIALLASQLFLTSWAEGFLERQPPAASPPPAPPPGRAPAAVAAAVDDRGVAPGPRAWELLASGGLRLRDLTSPSFGERVAIRPAMRIGGARALAELAYERGTAERTAGSVGWSIASAGAGVGWRTRPRARVALDATAVASIALVEANGRGAAAGLAGRSARGWVGDAALAAGPVASFGALRVGLTVEAGWLLPAATARVAGDRDVALGGPWAGASLFVAAARGRP
jgi:hypothetical protein